MTTTTNKIDIPASIQAKIDDLTPDFIPVIADLKKSIAYSTTQHGYGAYMSALHAILGETDLQTSNGKTLLFIVASAMVAAGGDARGIKAAAAIITGNDPMRAMFT